MHVGSHLQQSAGQIFTFHQGSDVFLEYMPPELLQALVNLQCKFTTLFRLLLTVCTEPQDDTSLYRDSVKAEDLRRSFWSIQTALIVHKVLVRHVAFWIPGASKVSNGHFIL